MKIKTYRSLLLCFQTGELDDVMYQAIMKNRVDFVQMFLENGVSPKDFLSTHRLLQLYNNVSEKKLELGDMKDCRSMWCNE